MVFYSWKKIIISWFFKDSKINLYGSTVSGFCLKDSFVDVDIHFDNKNSIDTLDLINDFLKKDDFFDVRSINNSVYDRITCKTKNEPIFFKLTSLQHPNSYRTSRLFNFYAKLDSRFKILAFCLRYLAKVILEIYHFVNIL